MENRVSYGQLNYVQLRIQGRKKVADSEVGKNVRRYMEILDKIDPEEKLRLQGNIVLAGDNPIFQIRTYESKANSIGFSLSEDDINSLPTVCVSVENGEFIYYFISQGDEIDRTKIVGDKVVEASKEKVSVKMLGNPLDIETIKKRVSDLCNINKGEI